MVVHSFLTLCSFQSHFMNKYAFRSEPARKDAEIAEGCGRLTAANAKHCAPRASRRVHRYRRLLQDKRFSLTIRADDGSTLLETHVGHMHQAFQRLIDWSIDQSGQDVCAVITGQNGFYTNHRIKVSRDFAWIESKEPVSEAPVQLRL